MIVNIYFLILLSFVISFLLFIPFINLLYKIGFYRKSGAKIRKDFFGKNAQVFNTLKNHKQKMPIPIGGGILVYLISILIFYLYSYYINSLPSKIINISLLGSSLFFLVGLTDDIKKFFDFKGKIWGLRSRYKLVIQYLISTPLSYFLLETLNINTNYSIFLIPVLATYIVYFANCFNITDGLDGLSMGTFTTTLIAMLIIAKNTGFIDFQITINLILGGTLAYLYFNVNPARLMLGDAGALFFGAFIAIFSIITNTWAIAFLYSLVFIIDGTSSLLQIAYRIVFKRKLFLIAPFHHLLEAKGWSETKITERLWLLNIVGVIIALAIYFFHKN